MHKPIDHEKIEEEKKLADEAEKNKLIKKIVAGNQYLLVLYHTGETFMVLIPKEDKTVLVARRVKELTNKHIIDISGSFTHCIVLQRDEVRPIIEWNSVEISEWFSRIGFSECANLAKYHKIDGKTIASADTDYYEDSLGIFEISQQQKLRYEVTKARNCEFKNINIYGWGGNTFGQLGVNDKYLNNFKRIPTPELSYKDDMITKVVCGRRNTAILTKHGELWIAGNTKHDLNKKYNQLESVKKLKNLEADSESDEDSKINKKTKKEILQAAGKNKRQGKKLHGHKNKKNYTNEEFENYKEQLEENEQVKKHHKKTRHNQQKISKQIEQVREDKKQVNQQEKSLEHRFINFTDLVTHSDDGIDYKIEDVCLGINTFCMILSIRIHPVVNTKIKTKNKEKKSKLKPIDRIFDQIINTSKYHPREFIVIYKDRFKGELEADLEVFLDSNDIPCHRVVRLLKGSEVYWDRQEKINNFNFM